ncbi:hypothetical protein [Thiorhodovibrio frisius]|uniref:Uncharacterized protein n=1 Tax=Thiorhodovibrio frisius TaxID=631362 RepID=H8Z4U6_9GAMM|nr:hypothetical protein [Thiorhodovibrio frisius]EIC20353.1 hypothetical protein Thi970DRAFT_03982 [Thiorhodovibrio frisius]WPL21093.1 hypothetical protein Thiofri_01201 [Thiorhodovibrio frisius]
MGTNIILLLALIAMIAIWIWLFRDDEGPVKTGRLTGKLSGSIPGSTIRIKATPPENEATANQAEAETQVEARVDAGAVEKKD